MIDSWKQCRLAELGTLRNGMNFNRHQEGPGVPVLKVKDFGDETFVPRNGLDELDPNKIKISDEQLLRSGDVVIIRSNGNIALVGRSMVFRESKRPTTFSGFCIRFRPDTTKLNPRFVAHFIRSPICRQRLSAYGSGTGIQNLSQEIIGNVPIDVPPLTEQQRIADILGSLDDKIELNRRMNETLESMARRLFKSWFVDFDPVHAKAAVRRQHPDWPNARVSREALPKLDPKIAELFPDEFEESALGPIPKGGTATTVSNAIEVNPPRAIAQGTVAPWLEMSNMPTRSARAIAWERRAFGSGTKFKNGDTLVARITPCLENGKTAFVDFLADGEVGAGSTEYIVLRPKPPLPPTFGYFLARNEDFRQHLITNMTGTSGRQRAPADCLNTYPIVVPHEEIANSFGDFADAVLEQMKMNDEESFNLAVARDRLLPKLLAGQIQVAQATNSNSGERA